MTRPLMPKATAVWLVDNTSLSFEQIAEFCELHLLEVSGIADGDVAIGVKGLDPVTAGQLTREEIARCEADPSAKLQLRTSSHPEPAKRSKGARYTPVSRRQDRPDAIAWLLRHHPELSDTQVGKLVGTTKATIQSVRDRSHWNQANLKPVDPVSLGLSTQIELDGQVRVAAERAAKAKERARIGVTAGETLRPMEQSISGLDAAAVTTHPGDEDE
ncbi:MAG: cell cycle transcriptional regulator TrcR [Alphaproteobacteria bacterium]